MEEKKGRGCIKRGKGEKKSKEKKSKIQKTFYKVQN